MEFAKYYNVNKVVKKLEESKELIASTYEPYEGIYVCEDTHDMWICRIIEGYNSEYCEEEGTYLIEREKISKYDLIDFIEETDTERKKRFESVRKMGKIRHFDSRKIRDEIIGTLDDISLIKFTLLKDEDNGLENWDNYEAGSIEDAIEIIDDGYGIIEL